MLASLTLLAVSQPKSNSVKQRYFKSYDYEQMGKYDEAIRVLTPLYKKHADGYILNLRFGWLFFREKKYKNSLMYYQKASIISPYAINPRLGIIHVYLLTEAYKKAESAAQELIKIDYYNYYANLYMIKALIAEKKYDTALQMVQKMLAVYPASVPFLEQLARIYKATGNTDLPKVYKNILILDPNNVMVRSMQKVK